MKTIRIGIFDEEESYAGKMSAYLNRMGTGRWNAIAFTDREALKKYLEKRHLHILVGTDIELLKDLKREQKDISVIWLREKEADGIGLRNHNSDIPSICRYTGAKRIGKTIGETASKILTEIQSIKPMVAIYSPVGRCGKTSLALRIVGNEGFGKWLYIGMEDYSSLERRAEDIKPDSIRVDDFLYYVKERNQEKLHILLNSEQRILPSAFSPFDTKQINETDIKWLFAILQHIELYSGVLFDIGTGVLQNPEWLTLFDYILVPFLLEEKAQVKKKNFQDLIEAYSLEELKEKMRFLDMNDKVAVDEKIEEIGHKRWVG